MQKTRHGVFETNSSSCHSFTAAEDKSVRTKCPTLSHKDHKIHLELGEFQRGDPCGTETDPRTKLQYLVTIIGCITPVYNDDGEDVSMGQLYWEYDSDKENYKANLKEMAEGIMACPEFKEVEAAAMAVWPECNGIVIGSKKPGTVDHESVPWDWKAKDDEHRKEPWEFFKEDMLKMSLEEFLGTNAVLHLDSD